MFRFFVFAIFFAAVFCAPMQARAGEVVDRIVAVVNGELITLFDIDEKAKSVLEKMKAQRRGMVPSDAMDLVRRKVLESMINNILLEQEAKRLEIEVTDADIENHIKDFRKKNNMSEGMFADFLALNNKTRPEHFEDVRVQMLRGRLVSFMVRRKVVVTDEEAAEYFESHRSEYEGGEKRVSLQLIVMPADGDAATLAEKINNNEISFADAAKQYSVGAGAQSGGELGEFSWGDLSPELKQALEGLGQGETSPPFSLNGQPALLRVKELKLAEGKSFDEVKDQLKKQLSTGKMDKQFDEYLKKLREKAVIKINL